MLVSPAMEEGGTSSSSLSQSGAQGWQRSPSTGLTGYDVPVCKETTGGKSGRITSSLPHRYLAQGDISLTCLSPGTESQDGF